MLKSYKNSYEQKANLIANWKTMDKNKLVNAYIEHENDRALSDAYLSAIICRYWGLIDKYYAQSYQSVSVEEVYDWLLGAILYALKHRKWKDPENKLYNDPAGPDKVINRCMLSSRRIFYQASNYHKRSINYKTTSLEGVVESSGDGSLLDDSDTYRDVEDCAENMIRDYFKKGKFFTSFFIDGIANYETFDKKNAAGEYKFNLRKLIRHLRHLDVKYVKTFSKRFSLEEDRVANAVAEVQSLTRVKMYNRAKDSMERLRRDKQLLEAKC